MWTSEQGALQEADARLCQLLEIPALRTPLRLYRRQLRPVVFSKGLHKAKLEVHHEFLWIRYIEDRMVENDYVYASVNRATGQIAELLANVSPLEEGLDLTADRAAEVFEREFSSRFPGATRCGRLEDGGAHSARATG